MNRNPVRRALAWAGLFCLSVAVPAQALESVADLRFCPGSRSCLVWSPSQGAVNYNLYRGSGSQLPAILDPAPDSCTLGSYAQTTTGPFPETTPVPGDLEWYLVGAADGTGAEDAGDASAGPRSVNSTGACLPSRSLVLNEVDYDQAGTDDAEFVEVFNPGSGPLDLEGIVLILVNGGTQTEYARVSLADAAATLPAGGYLVVGAPGLEPALPAGTPFVAFGSATNNLQNGAPDGLALFDTTTDTLLDALSYEGVIGAAQFDGVAESFSLVEGLPTPISDSNSETGTLARLPDGRDTGDAASDWFFNGIPSPGAANAVP